MYAQVDPGGDLFVGYMDGTVSIHGRQSYSISPLRDQIPKAIARSQSRRFVAVGTKIGVTVHDLETGWCGFRPIDAVEALDVADDGTCRVRAGGAVVRFDGLKVASSSELLREAHIELPRTVPYDEHALAARGVRLGPASSQHVSHRGAMTVWPDGPPRWFDFATGASHAIGDGAAKPAMIAFGESHVAVGTWDQHVSVLSLADGTQWRQKAFRKTDLAGDFPAFVVTPDGEVCVEQQVRGTICIEALAWVGPKGRRMRMALPQLTMQRAGLIEADATSALLRIDGRRGLWVFGANGSETQLVPPLDVRLVYAQCRREVFVVERRKFDHVVAVRDRIHSLEEDDEHMFSEAAVSPSGRWLAVAWSHLADLETRIDLWDVEQGRISVQIRCDTWGLRSAKDVLAVDDAGGVVIAIAPNVFAFFDREGARVREVSVLPRGEWMTRTRAAWAYSPDAFRTGGIAVRGRVLDQAAAITELGPPTRSWSETSPS